MELWIDRHCPSRVEEMVGNKKAREEVLGFVHQFRKGKALLLHGPSGVGKSLLPALVAKELQLHVIEISASDERGKDAIEGYASAVQTSTLFAKGKLVIIDEADGISGRDRGATQAIISLIKASSFPVILVANDPWVPKLKTLRKYCQMVKFTKIPSPSIEKRLREICQQEGVAPRDGVLKTLARFSDGDVRAAITDLQHVCLGRDSLELKDLEVIGYRERGSSVFNTLPTIFRSGKVAASRKLIFDGDKDPDEVLWWIEGNAHLEFPHALKEVFALLKAADHFRSLVSKQQNWAFKGYMVDMMAGVTVHAQQNRYISYKAPDRIIQLARTKQKRAVRDELCARLGKHLHCSKKMVRSDYLPYLKVMAARGMDLGLDPEDLDIIRDH